MRKNTKIADAKKFNLLRKWQTGLVSAFIAALVLTVLGGKVLMRQSAAQENDSVALGALTNFANATPISIPASGTVGNSAPYPSNIVVAGLVGPVAGVTIKLNNFNHTYPDDVDILLVGPGGQNAIIMSDVGGAPDAVGLTLTLNDAALSNLPDTAGLTSGTFKPTNITDGPDTFPAPAPAPLGGSALSVFNGTNPNGNWSLYIVDDSNLDAGTLTGGWELNITTAAPAPGQLQFSAPNYNGFAENAVTVTVNRVNGSSGAVTVDYATSNGSATGGASCGAGVDYISANGTSSFADFESSKTFTVQLCPDPAPDPPETINLTLSNPTGGATLGTPGTATLTIYTPGSTPCDITWRKIDNPHIISGTVTIPANQRVCIEPGVIVQWTNGSKIDLLGRMIGPGTSAERITFNHSNGANRIEVIGTLDLQFADVNVISNINAGGSLLCRNCKFGELGEIIATSFNIDSLPTRFVQIEDSVFDSNAATQGENAQLFAAGLTAIFRNVAFRNGAFCIIGNSYIYFDNVIAENSLITGMAFNQSEYQPLYLNNLSITNSAGAGIDLGHGNFEIGPNVVLQNNEYPVSGKGGLMPGSIVPASGNRNNWFEVGQPNAGGSMYPPIAVPYVIDSFSDIGSLVILPGARFKARSNFHFNTESGPVHILGLPDAPIIFEPFIAGQKWDGGQFNSTGDRMEYVTFDGSQRGVIDANSANGILYIDNSILKNNGTAISIPSVFLQGNLFANNTLAINSTRLPSVRASGRTNPNLFENNTTAVDAAFGSLPDVRYNWWNSPTGPTNPQNPGGTGDLITGTVYFQPFRTTRPDTTDHPPIVRMPHVPTRKMIEAGNKVMLNWTASDDHQIVKQKILYSPAGNARDSFYIIADNLPPTQREYELIVPATGFEVSGSQAFVRVVAIDDKGQEGWDEWRALTPAGQETGVLQITSNVAGQTFRGNQRVPLTWTVTAAFQFPPPDFNCYIVLDADRELISAGGGSNGQCFLPPMMPMISTDSARFAVVANRGLNRQKWFFSEPFSIRPDSRYIDAPPQITMTSPAAGQEFPSGSIVPITWTASDDEALRQFNIQASTDGGRTWILIADNLPPATTNYNWQTPFGGGANDVRIRVIAVDRRFQNSSDGANRAFRLTSPPNAAPSVQLTFPANGASYTIGQAFFVAADASDSDGTIRRVEFYETTSQFAPLNTKFIGADTTPPYQIGWTYPFTDTHTITARVIDNRNAATTSAPVSITVQPVPLAPLPVGLPELTNPSDGETFNPGQNITLNALPSPSSYSTVRIEFYNGTTLIASDTTAPYEIVWNNVPAGRYTVFAKTIAGNGAEAISKPTDISVGISQQRTPFDFDGDGRADVSVFRPSDRVWYLNQSTAGFSAAQFGLSSDKIVPADYDGDGKTDIAVFRDGVWYILQSSNGQVRINQFGLANDIPQTGDYDGDGRADFAVFRPSDRVWYLLQSTNGFFATQFGLSDDKPVAGDYDGDGKTDIAVYRASNGVWHLLRSRDGYTSRQYGISTDKPVPADYDGDGKTDLAVYRDGVWWILNSRTNSDSTFQFGLSSDIPTPADYDGDGRADAAVFRNGVWYLLQSTSGVSIVQFGLANDIPIASAFVR